jgi:hypothetical protein
MKQEYTLINPINFPKLNIAKIDLPLNLDNETLSRIREHKLLALEILEENRRTTGVDLNPTDSSISKVYISSNLSKSGAYKHLLLNDDSLFANNLEQGKIKNTIVDNLLLFTLNITKNRKFLFFIMFTSLIKLLFILFKYSLLHWLLIIPIIIIIH